MHLRKYLTLLAILLAAVLAVQPALAVDNLADIVTGPATGNVTKTVVNYTADLEKDAGTQFYNYGVQSVEIKDYSNAIGFFDKALIQNLSMLKKTDALLYVYQGKTYAQIQLKNFTGAVATADAGLAEYPKDPMLWNNKGWALENLGKNQDALAAYDNAITNNQTYTKAYINKGDLLTRMGKYPEAVAAYNQANETDPFNIAAYDGLQAARKNEATSSQTTTIILVVVLLVAAGIAVWYIKFRKPSEPAPAEKKKKSKKKE